MLIYSNIGMNYNNAFLGRRSNVNIKGDFLKNMPEDFHAKIRNGHPLKDTFNKEENSLDIYSTGLYPANVLSNLAHKEFVFDGVKCSSIEGFLQSLKTPDPEKQREICQKFGGSAKKATTSDWKRDKILYWNGRKYLRDSEQYIELLKNVFKSCYEQNIIFKDALDSTKGMKLTHIKGNNNPEETIITSDELTKILTELRDSGKYDKGVIDKINNRGVIDKDSNKD